MRKLIIFLSVIIFLCILFVVGSYFIYLPTDILFTFPQYQESYGFIRPHNSLVADPVVQFEPWRVYAKQRLASFEIPFINDKSALGVPFLANPQTAMFFPLLIFYYIFPVGPAVLFMSSAKLFLMFYFSYIYLRSVDVKRNVAICAGILLMSSAFYSMWLLWPHTNVLLFFPLILYFIEKIRNSDTLIHRQYSLLSLSVCLAVLGGHPETLFLVVFLSSIYAGIRIFGHVKRLIFTYVFILCGFLLASFQLFPFIEYLFHSNMLITRQLTEHVVQLPVSSSVLLFIPYLFGGPHLEFYKPLFNGTNFQELLGGYVGLSTIILGLMSAMTLRKNSLVLFWICLGICSFGISYGLFPFTLIELLPIFNLSATQRFISFFGISLIILVALFLNQSYEKKYVERLIKPLGIFLLVLLCFLILLLLLPVSDDIVGQKYINFVFFLREHIFIMIFSFILSLYFIYQFYFKRQDRFLFFFVVAVFFQTFFLFGRYNTFVLPSEYYPSTQLVNSMKQLPYGTYLEVGNNAIVENVNLVYGFSNIENYDALEVRNFRNYFDENFPYKNQWGNIDEVTYDGLRKFGVSYVISDFDIRDKKITVSPFTNEVIQTLHSGEHIEFSFSEHLPLSGMRMLPATFNRNNTCTVKIEIEDDSHTSLVIETLECSDFTNNHYYTLSFPPVQSENGNYTVFISLEDSSETNTVSFYGKENTPYLAVLHPTDQKSEYTLLARGETWYLFGVEDSSFIQTSGSVESVVSEPELIQFVHSSDVPEHIVVSRTNYPGWEVWIDNEKKIVENGPLLSVRLPAGKHDVQFVYVPFSFYFGFTISVITGCALLLFVLRNERSVQLYSGIRTYIRKKVSDIPWYRHVEILTISCVGSICLILLFLKYFPIQFQAKDTTVINWIAIHNYPKMQDYLGLFILFPLAIFMSIFGWLVWILIKKHS